MPWKAEKDPYKIWLSEIILQQTRVEQGMEYYRQFIKKYPTIKKLAAAADNDVFKLWEGLGYYSRCKNILVAARYIVNELKGIFPDNYDAVLKMKGVGPYTAAAIVSFAYNQPYAVLDGNVNRVLARFFNIHTAIDSTRGKQQFNVLANELISKKFPALYNQAIMDFGATVCKPKLPLCATCVLKNNCISYKNKTVGLLPVKEKKITNKIRWFYYFVAQKNDQLYIKKRIDKDIWQNLHEFILIESAIKMPIEELLNTAAFKAIGLKKDKSAFKIKVYKQQLTHQTIYAQFIRVKVNPRLKPDDMLWISRDELKNLAFPKVINEFLIENINI